jgi:glycosyltransferase involved in cell wall biosynthesis
MIEAMACGTPVVGFDCGSTREVIDDGVTGFIVDSVEAAVAAADASLALDRRTIRRRFEQRFTSSVMARNYADLYAERLAGPGAAAFGSGDEPATADLASSPVVASLA